MHDTIPNCTPHSGSLMSVFKIFNDPEITLQYINQLFTSCLKKRTLGILLLQLRTTPSYFLSNIQMTELLIKQTDIKVTSSTTLRNNRVFHVLRQHDAAVVGAKRRGSLLTDDSSIKMLNNLIFASLLQQRGTYF